MMLHRNFHRRPCSLVPGWVLVPACESDWRQQLCSLHPPQVGHGSGFQDSIAACWPGLPGKHTLRVTSLTHTILRCAAQEAVIASGGLLALVKVLADPALHANQPGAVEGAARGLEDLARGHARCQVTFSCNQNWKHETGHLQRAGSRELYALLRIEQEGIRSLGGIGGLVAAAHPVFIMSHVSQQFIQFGSFEQLLTGGDPQAGRHRRPHCSGALPQL